MMAKLIGAPDMMAAARGVGALAVRGVPRRRSWSAPNT
jgi:hypothetical protein